MELKDIILSTLAELEEAPNEQRRETDTLNEEAKTSSRVSQNRSIETTNEINTASDSNDLLFLQNVRERILVLFEGFQSPNNQNIEAKIDLTLNFLEYLLASIDEHLEKANKPPLP